MSAISTALFHFLDGVGMKLKSAKSMRSTMATKLNEHDSTQP